MSTTTESEVPFAITTTFIAPTQCAESVVGLTLLKKDGFRIWFNHPLPVPGTTITSCYAPEFASSFLLEKGWGIASCNESSGLSGRIHNSGAFHIELHCLLSKVIDTLPFVYRVLTIFRGWDGFAPAANPPFDRP